MRHSMMCSTVVDLLEPLHDGELDIAEQVRVENHLELCASCHATARELREVREMMSAALVRDPSLETELARDLDAMSQSVVSQVRSEREASWPVQFARAFEDLHFVYAGLGAMSATVSCIAAIAGLLYFAPAQRDDSLSGLLAAMAAPGSNRNPLSLDERMELPRVDDDHVDVLEGLPESATPPQAPLALSLSELLGAVDRVLRSVREPNMHDVVARPLDVPSAITLIRTLLALRASMRWTDVVQSDAPPWQVLSALLGLLELARLGELRVAQARPFANVEISRDPSSEAA